MSGDFLKGVARSAFRLFEGVIEWSQPAFFLLVSSVLDNALRDAILLKMRSLSNNFEERLFENYGPS